MDLKNKIPVNSGCQISCNSCSISQLCLPVTLNENEMGKLDDIIERKKPFHKGDLLFEAGKKLNSIFAVRSGSFKSYTISEQGDEQITDFHLAGDIIGFDGLHKMEHQSYAQAMETAMVCEIPFTTLDELSGKLPRLRQQIMRMMSSEINHDQEMLLLLNKKTAEERLAAFIANLSHRFGERGFSKKEFRLTMTRGEIGNYLGLTVETISRLLSRFQKANIINVEGKFISILNLDELHAISGIKSE
ncbi:fumarate/nitrate reduction transcriptional regulator Fnr [Pseudoalteromonas denitrificans]|uniref:CRP/FNR family transcriptional regulator, anaerobic regulatory protein n=1 Tax=Pseudoalteromonas denitrificans DSM 6059 TaxID=1123010 RepID=A0A1I1P9P6_9GAMM|nr:fumarate/nitrate reduction transcriptional regulator Fnr [Pseudoalteromonas denitrificans]SFD06302.1 CRP/FNR family transcriptional regulator, anaerobic regulatory protein [Pseudoalteromonas denitrificans DSM 6059]